MAQEFYALVWVRPVTDDVSETPDLRNSSPLPDVGQDRFEGGKIRMSVGQNGVTHSVEYNIFKRYLPDVK